LLIFASSIGLLRFGQERKEEFGMKCGIIGLGDIAQKAYLPVITRMPGVELVLCTRNPDPLARVGLEYRLAEQVATIEELIATGIEAAFVHTATQAHYSVVKSLLEAGIHVYVDKPLAYTLGECRELVELAEARGLILMVGFNRRFAPMIAGLGEVPERRSVIIQKNRENSPAPPRFFVFDDFIHVVDTLRFLSPGPVEKIDFDARMEKGLLQHVLLRLWGPGFIALGSMGRDFGVNEEVIEVTAPGRKWRVRGLAETTYYHDNKEERLRFGDWVPVLHRRGFTGILEHFLDSVSRGKIPNPSARDSLLSHELCEKIAASLE